MRKKMSYNNLTRWEPRQRFLLAVETNLLGGIRMNRVDLLDSTLRDGAQANGISFSVEDKLNIVRKLDDLGVAFIEAGNPGSNPKDLEFFRRASALKMKNSVLAAFGSTRKKNISAEEDPNLHALLTADTDVVVLFGKCWELHVRQVLGTTPEENLKMIEESPLTSVISGDLSEV